MRIGGGTVSPPKQNMTVPFSLTVAFSRACC